MFRNRCIHLPFVSFQPNILHDTKAIATDCASCNHVLCGIAYVLEIREVELRVFLQQTSER